jgi:hypothetical protein
MKVTFTVVKPQEILCVRFILNAVENCEIFKKMGQKNTLNSYAPQFA